MKSFILPVVIIIGLITLFIFVDRKEFNRNNDIAQTNNIITTMSDQNDFETGIKSVVVSLAPAVVPVKTAEEAEMLNAEAIIAFEIEEKIKAKQRERLDEGYGLTYSETFKNAQKVSLSKVNEEQLVKNGYDLEDIKNREIPLSWNIDYSTIPSDAAFLNVEDGFSIVSNQGPLRLICKSFDGMRSSFIFEFSINNPADNDCDITFGVHNSGFIKNGYYSLVSDKIPARKQNSSNLN